MYLACLIVFVLCCRADTHSSSSSSSSSSGIISSSSSSSWTHSEGHTDVDIFRISVCLSSVPQCGRVSNGEIVFVPTAHEYTTVKLSLSLSLSLSSI